MTAVAERGRARVAAPETLSESPFLDDDSGVGRARAAIVLATLAIAGFLAWAALTPVQEMVSAQGVVAPEGFVQRVEHLEGGIVGSVSVTDGETVAAGQTLLTLDQASLTAALRRAEARREALAREIDRQRALAAGRAFSGSRDGSDIALSQTDAAEMAARHLQARLAMLRSEAALRAAEAAALEARVAPLQTELDIVSQRFVAYGRAHRENGSISGVALDNIQIRKLELEREQSGLRAELEAARLRVRIAAETEAEYLASVRRDALGRVAEIATDLAEVREEIARLEGALARSVITAPVDGALLSVAARNVGQVIPPGALIAEIVPAGADPLVETFVPAEEIGAVSMGMRATVKASAFDFMDYGAVDATVISVSPSSVEDANGRLGYPVRLRLARAEVGEGARARRLLPGMTMLVELHGERRTVLAYLLRPLRMLRNAAFTES